jgi:hypothetical protein
VSYMRCPPHHSNCIWRWVQSTQLLTKLPITFFLQLPISPSQSQIFSSAPTSHIFSLCSPFHIRDPSFTPIQNCLIIKVLYILSFMLYGCETWSLKLKEEHRLRVFENRVLGGEYLDWREMKWQAIFITSTLLQV